MDYDEWFKKHCGPKAKCNQYKNEKTVKERRRAWFMKIFKKTEDDLEFYVPDHPALDALDEQDCF